jgi:ankyrin repeat protein
VDSSNIHLIGKLQKALNPNAIKTDISGHQETIKQVRTIIQTSSNLHSAEYWIDWSDARWHIFSGELAKANQLYKKSFDKASFVAGNNLKYIIKEALVVAANQSKADIVFLKQLKWALINFGYDILSASVSKPSNTVSDTIESWEIEQWKNAFFQVFPKEGLYPDTDFDFKGDAIGPLIVTNPENIKPDYRNPDRTIKVGDTWKRPMPQIVWFSHNENIEICKRLIEKGADINVKSEVGDTPILIALEALNLTEVPYRSLNNELYKLISRERHDPETINTRTQKKRLLPIISAVQTSQLEIVDKILSMGADPNGRGRTDEQTALNVCLKLIGILKNPELSKIEQLNIPTTPEALDSIRRYSQGAFGFSLEDQKKNLEQMESSALYQQIRERYFDLMYQRICENMNLAEMRRVASLLIKAGADANAEHSSPIKGYTPLMLAAELDEVDLFEIMLVHGGDTAKTYVDPKSGRDVSINEIASYFDSRDILLLMS